MYSTLFSPIKICGMELKNRIIFPAMATHLAAVDGYVTDALIDYHAARAAGGSGLNILEATSVHASSAATTFLRICGDEYIAGLKKLTDAIRAAGGKSCVQLWQGGLIAAMMNPESAAIIPSDFSRLGFDGSALDMKEAAPALIQSAVKAFGEAAARAVKAGFDCVEFHAAHNYSPHMFLSPAFNKRTDEYGGSFERRARYPLNCIRAIRANVPKDYPVLMRINALDDNLENGLTRDDIVAFCKLAQTAGVDALDVSRGNVVSAASKYEVPSIDLERGFNVENAAYLREKTGMLTIAVGRINDPAQAEEILVCGKADMVVMGRAQICDPEFCNKAKDGRPEDIIKCIACNQGCFDRYVDGRTYPHISCLRNPAVGREKEYTLQSAKTPKKVTVIGGGMGGMEAAMALKACGHRPVLIEAEGHLGGQFLLAGAAPHKQEMRDAAILRSEQALRAGVEVRLNTAAHAALLDEVAPEAVINAAGSVPLALEIPGSDGANVYAAHDVLSGCVVLEKKTVAVVGGGLVGLETAEFLAEKSCDVIVIEAQDAVGKDIGYGRRICVMESLLSAGEWQVNTQCASTSGDGVRARCAEEDIVIRADAVVVAVGSQSRDMRWLEAYCRQKEIPYHVLGDAVKPRRAIDAIHEAVDVVRSI